MLLANHGVLVFHRTPELAILVGGVVEEAVQAGINAALAGRRRRDPGVLSVEALHRERHGKVVDGGERRRPVGRQLGLDAATFELVIGLATSRVFCRLPPGSVQPAAAPVTADWTLLDRQPAVLELPVLPQPPTARLATTGRVMLATAGRLARHFI